MKRQTTTRTTRFAIAWMAVLALGLTACQTTTEEPPPPDTSSSKVDDSDFKQGDMGGGDETPMATGTDIDLGTVYFDFDRSDIRSDARPTLRANAEALRGSGSNITIEGHCDERGSEEYNMALGERRASSVKRYLENLGVPRAQMKTVSYGESRAAVPGHNEAAWRYNRRAEFVMR